jgi:hypothetical protein
MEISFPERVPHPKAMRAFLFSIHNRPEDKGPLAPVNTADDIIIFMILYSWKGGA